MRKPTHPVSIRNYARLTTRQSNSIELSIHRIPSAVTNIATINCQAVSLGPSAIMLSNPIHAVWIIISGLHLLLLVDVGSLGVCHLLCEDFGAGLAERAEVGLHDGVIRKIVVGRLLLLNEIRVLLIGIVDGLRLGDDTGLLVDDGLDLETGC
jgi:hypothetical protein